VIGHIIGTAKVHYSTEKYTVDSQYSNLIYGEQTQSEDNLKAPSTHYHVKLQHQI
jgi:hypothetical protein